MFSIFSIQLAFYISNKPLGINDIVKYSLIRTIALVLFDLYVFIILEAIIYFIYFKYNFKTYVIANSIYLINNIIIVFIFKGTIEKFCYYISIYSNKFILISIIYLAFIFFNKYFYSYTIMKSNYSYSIKLNSINKHISAYLDSGNFLEYNSLPVIFINNKYLKGDHEIVNSIDIETINFSSRCDLYEDKITINNIIRNKKVYVCFVEEEKLPVGYQCLLNINIMKG